MPQELSSAVEGFDFVAGRIFDDYSNSGRVVPKATVIGLGVIVLVAGRNMLVSQSNIHRLIENEDRVAHTQKVLTTLEEVLARVTEAETGKRGYLITDNPDYLAPYESAVGA